MILDKGVSFSYAISPKKNKTKQNDCFERVSVFSKLKYICITLISHCADLFNAWNFHSMLQDIYFNDRNDMNLVFGICHQISCEQRWRWVLFSFINLIEYRFVSVRFMYIFDLTNLLDSKMEVKRSQEIFYYLKIVYIRPKFCASTI